MVNTTAPQNIDVAKSPIPTNNACLVYGWLVGLLVVKNFFFICLFEDSGGHCRPVIREIE